MYSSLYIITVINLEDKTERQTGTEEMINAPKPLMAQPAGTRLLGGF